ncbi:hypothetical protein RhiirA4_456739 [Rhizophagus irregularis]|uniref:Uncharacterized protein n=1 Tax=Rhizophagus irregularis TaxID=588596 RepID=A0A2I1G8E4_9GLOM|nr:hypothetical protein RhiirA4_456739 [Rhizophagus irregularis]
MANNYPPSINNENENLLRIDLISGRREVPAPDTPDEYLKLYKLCWDPNLDYFQNIKYDSDYDDNKRIRDDGDNDTDIEDKN